MINRNAWLAPALMAFGLASWVACSGSSPVSPLNSTPGPSPSAQVQATPASCPMLTSWYSTIHNITDTNQQATKVPVVGGAVVIDSTPLFNGRACNAEHNFCGGRACEDPRGADWNLIEGKSNYELRADGYQMRIGPLVPGVHRWRVCPHYDLKDALGDDVPQATSPCTEGSFEVMAPEK